MRRVAVLFICIAMLASCRIVTTSAIEDLDGNPFMDAIDLTRIGHDVKGSLGEDGTIEAAVRSISLTPGSVIEIPVITDVHADKEGGHVSHFNDPFFAFLDKGSYPFLINLGDLLNSGHYEGSKAISFYAEAAMKTNGNQLLCIGNHELFDETSESFDHVYSSLYPEKETMRMGRYVYGPLSIYMLDNSLGIFGRQQLLWLEDALKADDHEFKIIIAHENMAASRASDQSLVITGMTDQREVHRMMKMMGDYGVQLMLTGHHHQGNLVYRFRGASDSAEVNLAAFHRNDNKFNIESMGFYYLLRIDTSSGVFEVRRFDAETGEELEPLYSSAT